MLIFINIFIGLTGDITINENGDREADYTLNDLDPTGNMTVSIYASKLIVDLIS